MKYYLCKGSTTSDLMREVDLFVRHGYEPMGGVAVAGAGYDLVYVQAMVHHGR